MKRGVVYLAILITSILMVCCANEPYEDGFYIPESGEVPDTMDEFQNTFSAKLDGQTFVNQHIYTMMSNVSTGENFIAITATKTDYHSIIIYLPSDILPGNYRYNSESLLATPNLNVTYSNLETVLESGIGDGELTIDEHSISNHHIKGTFECVVNSQNGSVHRITDGKFDVVYQ